MTNHSQFDDSLNQHKSKPKESTPKLSSKKRTASNSWNINPESHVKSLKSSRPSNYAEVYEAKEELKLLNPSFDLLFLTMNFTVGKILFETKKISWGQEKWHLEKANSNKQEDLKLVLKQKEFELEIEQKEKDCKVEKVKHNAEKDFKGKELDALRKKNEN